MTTEVTDASLDVLLRTLKLPSFVKSYEELALKADKDGWGCTQYLRHLVEMEIED